MGWAVRQNKRGIRAVVGGLYARQVDLLLCSAMAPFSDSPDQHGNLGNPRTSRTRGGGIERYAE